MPAIYKLSTPQEQAKLDHHFAVHSHLLEVSRPHSYSPFKACPRFTPAHLLTPAEFYMR